MFMFWRKYPLWFRYWIPLAGAITIMCGLVYATVQQNFRQSANDPQIQMAEDALHQLEKGENPVKGNIVDAQRSLSPFLISFDDKEKVASSTVQLDGKTPIPPAGLFQFVRKVGYEWFTWEPKEDVRIATVLMRTNGDKPGFILAGRNMREVEKRESRLEFMVFAAWVVALGSTLIASILLL